MYPVNVKMNGTACLVIGGGHIALRKVKKLIQEGAKVTVLSPEICEELLALYRERRVLWRPSSYRSGDTAGYHFVVTATGNQEVAEAVHEESTNSFFLYNAADFPALGNCSLPAAFESGGIHFAISTDGRSPAMAKYIKTWMKSRIPSSFGLWLDRVGEIRKELKEELSDSGIRESFWHVVFSDQIMNLVLSGDLDEAEERVRHAIGCFRP